MSGNMSIAQGGEYVEIHQSGREVLLVSPNANPTLSIDQSSGGQIALSQTIQSLTLTETVAETLVIAEPGGDTLVVSDTGAGVVLSPYGHPHTHADDGEFYYYAWQHADGTQWKAQQFELSTLELRTATGENPQPQSSSEFESIGY